MIVYSEQNETIDALVWRVFGVTRGLVEQVYQLNTGLCDLPTQLPLGVAIVLPDFAELPKNEKINLWN